MRPSVAFASLLASGLTFGAAHAQSVDYSGFEQLFGEPVTTSATGKPQRISDVPANMEIITADDIRRSGADNLPDILQYVAGMNVRRYGFAAADVGIRGYNETSNPRLLVLVNGQQVYFDDLGRTQWYTLPVQLDEIRQIEIVKGPNTALFGFNAVSGVINIITYDPLLEPVNRATVRWGSAGYQSASVVGTGRIGDKGGIRISADEFRGNEYPVIAPDDQPFRQSPLRNAISFDARYQVTPEIQLSLSGAALETRVWEATAAPWYGTDFHRTNWVRAGVSADTPIGLLNFSIYRNELLYVYNGASEWENYNGKLVVVQASDLVKLGADHTLRFGFDYRNNTASAVSILAGRIGYEVLSGSTMWDWQITPKLSLTNAVRYDHFVLHQSGFLYPDSGFPSSAYNNRTINEPSFNSGLVWKATEADTFRLLGARGLQLPSVWELGMQDRQPPGSAYEGWFYIGNPRLKPASINNVELDWDRSIPAIHSTLRSAIFAQRTDNMLINAYEVTPVATGEQINGVDQFRLYAANIGHSSALGGEIGLYGHSPSGFRWKASYSFISVSDHLELNQTGIYSPLDYQHGAPRHVIILGGGYTYDRWEFDAQARWQSTFTDYRADPTQATLQPITVSNYITASARVGFRVTDNITAALSAQQFNASTLLVSAGSPVQRRLLLTLTAHL